jgi:hypothetical protein
MENYNQMPKRKTKQVALLGLMLICLGVVFMKSGGLGTIFMLAGAGLVIVALIRRNR